MNTLTVHPANELQEKALKAVFEAMEIKYEEEMDTTEYLLSNPVMKAHLEESMQQANEGKVTPVTIKDLWK